MGNVFGSFSLTKRKALLAVLVTLLVFHRRIINKMKERHRAYVLMKLIPAPKLPAGQKENLLLSNAVTYYISNKNIFNSAEEVQKKALKGLRKILEDNPKMKEVGVINIPVFAGWMERSNPFHIVSFPIVIGNDKVKEFLSAKAMGYYSKGSSYQVSHSLIGDSVLSTSGKIWHTQRKIAEKGFTDEIMVYAVPKICKTVNELTEKLKNRLLSKVWHLFYTLQTFLDSISHTVYMRKCSSLLWTFLVVLQCPMTFKALQRRQQVTPLFTMRSMIS